jgi:hypothetical protein
MTRMPALSSSARAVKNSDSFSASSKIFGVVKSPGSICRFLIQKEYIHGIPSVVSSIAKRTTSTKNRIIKKQAFY